MGSCGAGGTACRYFSRRPAHTHTHKDGAETETSVRQRGAAQLTVWWEPPIFRPGLLHAHSCRHLRAASIVFLRLGVRTLCHSLRPIGPAPAPSSYVLPAVDQHLVSPSFFHTGLCGALELCGLHRCRMEKK